MRPATALLCLHGFLGSPRQFDALRPMLPQDWAMLTPWLPGHGSDAKALAQSSMSDWEKVAEAQVQRACAQFDRVYLLGHSMGGLLWTELGTKYPVHGLVAVAMPLRFRYRPHALRNCMSVAFTKKPCLARDMCGVAPHPLLACAGWLPRYLELFRKAKQVERILPALSIPACFFYFEKDELCAPSSMKRIPASMERITLAHSRHSEWTKETYAAIAGALCRMAGVKMKGEKENDL